MLMLVVIYRVLASAAVLALTPVLLARLLVTFVRLEHGLQLLKRQRRQSVSPATLELTRLVMGLHFHRFVRFAAQELTPRVLVLRCVNCVTLGHITPILVKVL